MNELRKGRQTTKTSRRRREKDYIERKEWVKEETEGEEKADKV